VSKTAQLPCVKYACHDRSNRRLQGNKTRKRSFHS